GTLHAHAWDRSIELTFKTLVDATGEASACRAAGLPLREEDARQAGAFVFSMAGLPDVDETLLQRMIQREVAEGIHAGRVPQSLSRVSLVPGSSRRGGAELKLGLDPSPDDSPLQRSEEESTARRLTHTLIEYLRSRADFATIMLRGTASLVGVRTGHSPIGDYTLTEDDILDARPHADGVGMGSWSIEFWSERRQPLLRHIPLDSHYEIPARALFNSTYPNTFFAGRNISATSWALASSRVIGTCLETGFAAGALAAGVAAGRSVETIVSGLRADRSDETRPRDSKRVGGLDG
ncbi:MAG: FAD-dependent oxidoreductase, partial [Deltaproteobacteria bacterium]|nr:FAD-dependent oxidoreductase [Deltaproteobacteria bacterium]